MKSVVLALVVTLLLAFGGCAPAVSFKRGAACGGLTCQDLKALSAGVSWWYNWMPDIPQEMADCTKQYGMEYIPMQKTANNIDQLPGNIEPGSHYIFVFNEPNSPQQANLTPQEAAEKWKEIWPKIRNLGLKIGSPSPNPGNRMDPMTWWSQFFKACGNCQNQFDFMTTHAYFCDLPSLSNYLTQIHNKWKKDVWLTEFSCPLGSRNNSKAEITYMDQVVPWLEQTPWIGRYAWLHCRTRNSLGAVWTGPSVNLLDSRFPTLTQVGRAYVKQPVSVPLNSTSSPTTSHPTTVTPATTAPHTTAIRTTAIRTTAIRTTAATTTAIHPTTFGPTTKQPSTSAAATTKPTTSKPTTAVPTTTARPTTAVPTTARSTTVKPTAAPTTRTTTVSTTQVPTTTIVLTTAKSTTAKPPMTTAKPTVVSTTAIPTTPVVPTTVKSTTAKPTTTVMPTAKPTTPVVPTTLKSTTAKPTTTAEPTSAGLTTAIPSTVQVTDRPSTVVPTTERPKTAEPSNPATVTATTPATGSP